MIDAYTIGITLALDNGVSDGISAIRRDLASFDRAVEQSIIGLRRLRDLASELGLQPTSVMPRFPANLVSATAERGQEPKPAVPTSPQSESSQITLKESISVDRSQFFARPNSPSEKVAVVRPEPFTSEGQGSVGTAPLPVRPQPTAPLEPKPVSPRNVQAGQTPTRPPEGAVPTLPVVTGVEHSAAGPSPRASVPVTATASPIVAMAPRPPENPQKPHSLFSAPLSQRAPKAPDQNRSTRGRQESVAQTGGQLSRTRENSMPVAPGRPSGSPNRAEPSSPGPSKARIRPALSDVPRPMTSTSAPRARLTEDRVNRSPSQARPANAVAPNPPARLSKVSVPPETTRGTSIAPKSPMRDSSEQPISVEVMLDGAVLARWLDNHLARSFARPPSGVTGFDPRMTRTWAGPPIGF